MKVVHMLVLGVVFVGALACAAVFGQAGPEVVPTPPPGQGGVIYSQGPYWYAGMTPAAQQGTARDAQLAQDYVKADKEEAKKEIRKKLSESLAKQFDQHIQQQQKELEDLEKQIASLKAVLKKRLDAKNDIVERRLDQLVRDAEGLGWTGPGSPRHGHRPATSAAPAFVPAPK